MDEALKLAKEAQAAFERSQKATELALKRGARCNQLKAIIEGVTFEHLSKYAISVEPYGDRFYLNIVREVPDSRTGLKAHVNNSAVLKGDVTNEAFVKTLFCKIGQFEAHEFAETFKVFDKHAYFPHEAGKGFAWFKQGEALNKRLLEVWRHVESDRADAALAWHYFGLWFGSWPIVVLAKRIDRWVTYNGTLVEQWLESKWNRVKFKVSKIRAKLDMAWKAFKVDPMDVPNQGVSFSFTINMHTGEIKTAKPENNPQG